MFKTLCSPRQQLTQPRNNAQRKAQELAQDEADARRKKLEERERQRKAEESEKMKRKWRRERAAAARKRRMEKKARHTRMTRMTKLPISGAAAQRSRETSVYSDLQAAGFANAAKDPLLKAVASSIARASSDSTTSASAPSKFLASTASKLAKQGKAFDYSNNRTRRRRHRPPSIELDDDSGSPTATRHSVSLGSLASLRAPPSPVALPGSTRSARSSTSSLASTRRAARQGQGRGRGRGRRGRGRGRGGGRGRRSRVHAASLPSLPTPATRRRGRGPSSASVSLGGGIGTQRSAWTLGSLSSDAMSMAESTGRRKPAQAPRPAWEQAPLYDPDDVESVSSTDVSSFTPSEDEATRNKPPSVIVTSSSSDAESQRGAATARAPGTARGTARGTEVVHSDGSEPLFGWTSSEAEREGSTSSNSDPLYCSGCSSYSGSSVPEPPQPEPELGYKFAPSQAFTGTRDAGATLLAKGSGWVRFGGSGEAPEEILGVPLRRQRRRGETEAQRRQREAREAADEAAAKALQDELFPPPPSVRAYATPRTNRIEAKRMPGDPRSDSSTASDSSSSEQASDNEGGAGGATAKQPGRRRRRRPSTTRCAGGVGGVETTREYGTKVLDIALAVRGWATRTRRTLWRTMIVQVHSQ